MSRILPGYGQDSVTIYAMHMLKTVFICELSQPKVKMKTKQMYKNVWFSLNSEQDNKIFIFSSLNSIKISNIVIYRLP